MSVAGRKHAVQFRIVQRSGIAAVLVLLPRFIVVAVEPATLGSNPESTLTVGSHADSYARQFLDEHKAVVGLIVTTKTSHRRHPQLLPVAVDDVAAVIMQSVISRVMTYRPTTRQPIDTASIGTHPQIVTVLLQRMDILVSHDCPSRVVMLCTIHDTVQTRIVAGYPQTARSVLAEP